MASFYNVNKAGYEAFNNEDFKNDKYRFISSYLSDILIGNSY